MSLSSKKIISIVLTLMTMTAMFTGCQSSSKSSSTSKGGKTITIWTNFQVEVPTLEKYAKEWSQKTGNTVKILHQDAGIQQFTQAANSPQGPDALYGVPNDKLATFVTANLVQEVPSGTIKNNEYAQAAIKACNVNGKQYGVPIAVETTALYYNTDKIKTAPSTWDELIDEASKNGGIMFDATGIYYNLGFVRAYGGYIFKDSKGVYDTKDIGLGNDGSVKAYSYINDLVNKYKFIKSDVTVDIAKSNFQNGKTAFYIGGPWDVSGFKAAGTKFAVAPMPKLNNKNFVTPVGTQVAFVSAKSKNKETTWEFIKYMLDNSALSLYEVGNRIPAKLSYQNNKEVQSNEYTKAFVQQVAHGEPLPTIPELDQVWTPFQNNMKLMFTGKETPDKAAQNIVSQIKQGIGTMNSGK